MAGNWLSQYTKRAGDDTDEDEDGDEERYLSRLREKHAHFQIGPDETDSIAPQSDRSLQRAEEEYAMSNMFFKSTAPGNLENVDWQNRPRLVEFVHRQARKYLIPEELAFATVMEGLGRLRACRVKKDWKVWLHKSSERARIIKLARENAMSRVATTETTTRSNTRLGDIGSIPEQQLTAPFVGRNSEGNNRRGSKRRQDGDSAESLKLTATLSDSALSTVRGSPQKIHKDGKHNSVGFDPSLRPGNISSGSTQSDTSVDYANRVNDLSQEVSLGDIHLEGDGSGVILHTDTSEKLGSLTILSEQNLCDQPWNNPSRGFYTVRERPRFGECPMDSLSRTPSNCSVNTSHSQLSMVTSEMDEDLLRTNENRI